MSYYKKAVIIWLDPHINQPNYCQTLKNALSTTLDVTWSPPIDLDDINIDNLIKDDFRVSSYSHTSSAIKRKVFDKEKDCIQYVQKNKDKKIFFIISSSIGEQFVPKILANYSKTLQTSVGDKCDPIYVFCSNILNVQQWARNYIQYVQIFGNEINLLIRLTRDIGDYFVNLGQKQYDDKVRTSIHQSLKYFRWAKILFIRANEIEKTTTSDKRERSIDNQIVRAEALLEQFSDNDDDIHQYMLCGETTDESDTEMSNLYLRFHLVPSSSTSQTEIIDTENNLPLSESNATIPSTDIGVKLPSQTMDFFDDPESISDVCVCLLLPSPLTENFKRLCSTLKQLFGANLNVLQKEDDYLKIINKVDLPSIVLPVPTDDDNLLLEKICSIDPPPLIYLLQSESCTENKRQQIVTKYHQICAMLNDAEELAVKIAIDVALKCRILGNRYARNNEKKRSNKMYNQCIELLKQLDSMAQMNLNN